tara:strand:+ start:8392 stop:8580 length:189 start_codon:yes stop_codon:yes gene_type:complete
MIHEDKNCPRSIALVSRGNAVVEKFIGVLYRRGVEVYRTGSEAGLFETIDKIESWEADNPDK